MAGESAAEIARRQRERAARLERSAASWERGAEGERATAALLDRLTAYGWVVLHDLAWPGRPRANLDHVVIGPGGLFVIDTKNWSGIVKVRDGVLWQGSRRREREVAAAAEAALAVTRLVEGAHGATGVLCFVSEERLVGWSRDVMICSTANVLDMLRSRQPVLTAAQVDWLSAAIQRLPGGAARPRDGRTVGSAGHVSAALPVWERPASGRTAGRRRASRSRTLRATERRTTVKGLVLLAAVMCAAWAGLPELMANAPAMLGLTSPHGVFGETVPMHGSSVRPALSLVADHPVRLRANRARHPIADGQRLVGIRVEIDNASARNWQSPILGLGAEDSRGITLLPTEIRHIARGPVLKRAISLTPGGRAEGYVAFTLPRGAKLSELRLTLGTRAYDTVVWRSGH